MCNSRVSYINKWFNSQEDLAVFRWILTDTENPMLQCASSGRGLKMN